MTSAALPLSRHLRRGLHVAFAMFLFGLGAFPASLVWAAPDAAEAAAPGAPKKGDYRLAPRDLVQFLVFEEADTLSIQRVSSTGEISVPMLGTIKVGGATLREAELNLAKAFVEKGFFIKPQVILSVQTYAPRSISVLGQVNHPEQIDLPLERESIGIVQAIALAGGLTRVAKTDGVRVIRNVEGKEEQYTINLAQYLDTKSTAEFKLQADDVVYVPERAF